ncbi:hypothetical protein [Azospirillum sp. B2RO_4]|uniref:hypothetical protein n=1 Tax=Azospirillum sp. B2RO_4 TaxID=3027796 RepID=UPI003DA8E4C7
MRFWELPGPAGHVNAAVDALISEGCVLIESGGDPKGFATVFAAAYERRDIGTLTIVDLADVLGLPPAEALMRRLLPRETRVAVATARTLCQSVELEGEAVVLHGAGGHWQSWDIFMRAFARDRLRTGSVAPLRVAVLMDELPARPGGDYPVLTAAPLLGRIDTALYVAQAMRGRGRGAFDLALIEALIIELTGWNLPLADALVRLPEHTLFAPFDWLREQQAAAVPMREWDGAPFRCSVAAATANDRRTIARRVWKGQLHTVFPWLEEVRLQVVDAYANPLLRNLPLQTPYGTTITVPEDLEFGAITHLLRNQLDRPVRAMLERMAEVRNCLAHREPVDGTKLKAVQSEFETWRSGTAAGRSPGSQWRAKGGR